MCGGLWGGADREGGEWGEGRGEGEGGGGNGGVYIDKRMKGRKEERKRCDG